MLQETCIAAIITGPPTHSVGGQISNGRWRLASSVGVCNTSRPACTLQPVSPAQAMRWLHAACSLYSSTATPHGGPVVLRPVRVAPCFACVVRIRTRIL